MLSLLVERKDFLVVAVVVEEIYVENCREPCRINGFFSTGPCAFHRKFSQSTVEKIFSFKKPQIFHKNYLTFHKPLWKTFGATKSTAVADKKRHHALVMHRLFVYLRSNAKHGFRALLHRFCGTALYKIMNQILKVLLDFFQKIAVSKGSAFGRASQGAKYPPAAAGETPHNRTHYNRLLMLAVMSRMVSARTPP